MKAHDISKKLKELGRMESKLLRRLDSIQRNLFSLRTFKQSLERDLAAKQDSEAPTSVSK